VADGRLAFAWSRRVRRERAGSSGRPAIGLRSAVVCLVLFAIVTGPWWARQVAELGTLSPSLASGKVLLIRTIEEWHSVRTPATIEHFLGQGPDALVTSRLGGLLAALGILAAAVAGVVLVPFVLVGGWRRRRSVAFGPFLVSPDCCSRRPPVRRSRPTERSSLGSDARCTVTSPRSRASSP
jgi:hypothetical protein